MIRRVVETSLMAAFIKPNSRSAMRDVPQDCDAPDFRYSSLSGASSPRGGRPPEPRTCHLTGARRTQSAPSATAGQGSHAGRAASGRPAGVAPQAHQAHFLRAWPLPRGNGTTLRCCGVTPPTAAKACSGSIPAPSRCSCWRRDPSSCPSSGTPRSPTGHRHGNP